MTTCLQFFRRRPGSMATLIALAAAVTVLTSCGSGQVNPSRSPNLTSLRPPQTQTETKTQTQTESHTAIQTRTATQTQTQTRTATQAAQGTPKSTPTSAQPAGAASNSGSSTPAWLWWLIGVVALAAVATTVVLLRRRSKKQAWAGRFDAAKGQVAWFARELIPQLGRAPTVQQMAGGWRIEANRIVAIEDQLTTVEATAVDDVGRGRARTLRGAVRGSRTQLAGLDDTADMVVATNLLRSAAAELESALSSIDPAARTDLTRAR
jgi:hypothetical protein